MKKFLLLTLVSFLSINSFSQTQFRYLDSLDLSLQTLSEINQLKAINQIPYDKFVGDVKKSEDLFYNGAELAIKLEDSLALGDIYLKLGQVYAYTENFEKRTEFVLKSIKIYELLGENVKAGISYGQLGYNLKYSDMDNALRYMRRGIKLLESEKNITKIDPLYDNYGIMLTINKKLDSALFYTKKSLKLKKKLKDSVGLGYGYANVATVYADADKLELAKVYIDSSSIIRTKIEDNYGIAVNYTHLADVLLKQNLYSEAINSYQKSASLAKQGKYLGLERYCYNAISEAYVELNDYKQAYVFGEKFQRLKDSVLNSETSNKVEQLKIEFETEKKENEILLQRADLAEKERDISEKNSFILGLVGLALVVSLLGFLVYNQQKLKNKQLKKEGELKEALVKIETQSTLQDQRLRISRDLHDNIGAQLTFIISSLDNLKYGFKLPDNLNAKLDTISEFTTSTIYELRDTIWAMNKSAISFEDLQSRISNFMEKANKSTDSIIFSFDVSEGVEPNKLFTSVQGMNIYRIIQESVNNALKYANPTTIDVNFSSKENAFEMTITDNGTGFNANNVTEGNGLENIKKRAHELDAELEIMSSEKGGTTIRVFKSETT